MTTENRVSSEELQALSTEKLGKGDDMAKNKRFLRGILVLMLCMIAIGYGMHLITEGGGIEDDTIDPAEVYYATVEDSSFVVTVHEKFLEDDLDYLEFKTDAGFYTEFPIDDENNYILRDWLTLDGEFYTLMNIGEDGELSQWVSYPSEYKLAEEKSDLFIGYLTDNLKSPMEFHAKESLDLGSGEEETISIYKAQVEDEALKNVVTFDSLYLSNAILESGDFKDKDREVIEEYTKELDGLFDLSEGFLYVGVDEANKFRFKTLEVLGMGSSISVTRTLHVTDDFDKREMPNFETAKVVPIEDVFYDYVMAGKGGK